MSGKISLDEYMRETERRDKKIEELTKAIETGFMEGAYARLKNLQEIEEKYYKVEKIIDLCREWYRSANDVVKQSLWYEIGVMLENEPRPTKRAADVGVCTCKKPLWANNGKYNICVSCLRPQRG